MKASQIHLWLIETNVMKWIVIYEEDQSFHHRTHFNNYMFNN